MPNRGEITFAARPRICHLSSVIFAGAAVPVNKFCRKAVDTWYQGGVKDSRKSEPEEHPEEPGHRHKVFWVYVLILGGGVVIFFLGGLWVRNPDLPSYLYSQISGWLGSRNRPASGGLRPPPSPKTAEDYLALTHYDVRTLSAVQRAVALALVNLSGETADARDRLSHLAQTVLNDLPSLKSADALAAYQKIKPEATRLLDAADRQKNLFENLESNLATQLQNGGLNGEMAKEVAQRFYQDTPGRKAVDEAAKQQKLATELIAIANLLAETTGKWQVWSDGTIRSLDKKLDEEYGEHHNALMVAVGNKW
jgi:hypothetical protein